jgi:hypothetical protein
MSAKSLPDRLVVLPKSPKYQDCGCVTVNSSLTPFFEVREEWAINDPEQALSLPRLER